MSLLQVLVLGGMALVVLALVAAWVGEVFGLNGRLDAADEEEQDWTWPPRTDPERHWTGAGDADDFEVPANVMWPHRIDQRRD